MSKWKVTSTFRRVEVSGQFKGGYSRVPSDITGVSTLRAARGLTVGEFITRPRGVGVVLVQPTMVSIFGEWYRGR